MATHFMLQDKCVMPDMLHAKDLYNLECLHISILNDMCHTIYVTLLTQLYNHQGTSVKILKVGMDGS